MGRSRLQKDDLCTQLSVSLPEKDAEALKQLARAGFGGNISHMLRTLIKAGLESTEFEFDAGRIL